LTCSHAFKNGGQQALVVTNKNDPHKKDVYYLYLDYLGSLIAVAEQGQGLIL
jgi:hypothetical protein